MLYLLVLAFTVELAIIYSHRRLSMREQTKLQGN